MLNALPKIVILICLSLIHIDEPTYISKCNFKGYIYSPEYLHSVYFWKFDHYFTPTVGNVIGFEDNLNRNFDTLKNNPLLIYRRFSHGVKKWNLRKYYRLYHGFVKNGDSILYIHFVHKSHFDEQSKIYGTCPGVDYFKVVFNVCITLRIKGF